MEIQHVFCSHALTNGLYPFIHHVSRCGSTCGGKYESKWLLSLTGFDLVHCCLLSYLYFVVPMSVSTVGTKSFKRLKLSETVDSLDRMFGLTRPC